MARIKIGNVRTPIDYLKQFFAPAGFGLGLSDGEWVSSPDDIAKNGFYRSVAPGVAPGVAWYVCICYSDDHKTVIGFKEDSGGVAFMRTMKTGVWGEWEFANPPMNIDMEYRTTERFKGKPVYRKIVAYNLPTSTNTDFTVPHGISDFDTLVRQTASVGAGVPLPYTHNGNTTCVKELDATNIKVSNSGQSWDTSYTWNFYLYYTKTTD